MSGTVVGRLIIRWIDILFSLFICFHGLSFVAFVEQSEHASQFAGSTETGAVCFMQVKSPALSTLVRWMVMLLMTMDEKSNLIRNKIYFH